MEAFNFQQQFLNQQVQPMTTINAINAINNTTTGITTDKIVELKKDEWFVQPVPKSFNHTTVGVKIPMNVEVKTDLMTPVELKKQLQTIELSLKTQQDEQMTLPQKTFLQQLQRKIDTTLWHEIVDFKQLPVQKLRVFYAPQERVIVVKVRVAKNLINTTTNINNLFNNTVNMEQQQQLQQQCQQFVDVIERDITSQLQREVINNINLTNTFNGLEQQQMIVNNTQDFITYKKVIQIPQGVCPRTLVLQFNREQQVLLVKSVVDLTQEDEELLQRQFCYKTQMGLLKKLIEERSICKRCHDITVEPCMPTNLIVKLHELLNICQNNERFVTKNLLKYIICQQTPELFYASKKIRQFFKTMKQICFNGMMKTPTFIRVPETNEHRVRLQFVLPKFTAETMKVKILEPRKRIVIIEAQRDIVCPQTGLMMTKETLNRQFVVPELLDIERLAHIYDEKTGILMITFPVNQERSKFYYRQLQNQF